MKELYFYPTLNEDSAKDYGIEVADFSFMYKDVVLKVDDEKGVLYNPEEKIWLVQNNGMTVRTSIRLKTPEKLYGKDGVVCSGSKIGFYAIWSYPGTMQSNSCMFESNDGVNFEFSQYFAPEMIKGTLNITVHAFVEYPAETVLDGECFLMNERGVSIGIIASKVGRKKTILVGVIILFIAFFLGCIATEKTKVLVYFTMGLAGIGWATINVNSYPMIVEMSKGSNVGKYTGYYYTASMFAQIVTPVLSGALMDLSGTMKVLFPYSCVFCVLAFLTMSFVKHGDYKPESKKGLEALDVDD